MQVKNTKIIEKDLRAIARDGRLDDQEMLAALDAIGKVWNKSTGKETGEDLYEKVIMSMPHYRVYSSQEEVDLSKYYSTFPRELIKGIKLEASNEEIVADLMCIAIDKAVETRYESDKNITVVNQTTYKGEMEEFENQVATSASMIDTIKKMGGQASLDALKKHLSSLAQTAITTQREYFFSRIENMIAMRAKSIIINQEREERAAQELVPA